MRPKNFSIGDRVRHTTLLEEGTVVHLTTFEVHVRYERRADKKYHAPEERHVRAHGHLELEHVLDPDGLDEGEFYHCPATAVLGSTLGDALRGIDTELNGQPNPHNPEWGAVCITWMRDQQGYAVMQNAITAQELRTMLRMMLRKVDRDLQNGGTPTH